jgi:hypothetical protein
LKRREFLSLAALTAVHGKFAVNMVASVAAADPGPLATIQTTHGVDLVIAGLADRAATRQLRAWMGADGNPVVRVNAAGILAKLPGQGAAREVADVLVDDDETRRRYVTAVVARVCAIDWSSAERITANPASIAPARARFVAERLATEVLNPADAGARWCSAAMLRDLSPTLR